MHEIVLQVIGILTLITSVLVKIIGFPDQIKQNIARKSTKGVSFWLTELMNVSYILWFLYGLLKKDWVIIIANGLGVIGTSFVLFQFLKYRKILKNRQ